MTEQGKGHFFRQRLGTFAYAFVWVTYRVRQHFPLAGEGCRPLVRQPLCKGKVKKKGAKWAWQAQKEADKFDRAMVARDATNQFRRLTTAVNDVLSSQRAYRASNGLRGTCVKVKRIPLHIGR
jgi:hypothetical protein